MARILQLKLSTHEGTKFRRALLYACLSYTAIIAAMLAVIAFLVEDSVGIKASDMRGVFLYAIPASVLVFFMALRKEN